MRFQLECPRCDRATTIDTGFGGNAAGLGPPFTCPCGRRVTPPHPLEVGLFWFQQDSSEPFRPVSIVQEPWGDLVVLQFGYSRRTPVHEVVGNWSPMAQLRNCLECHAPINAGTECAQCAKQEQDEPG